MVKTRNRQPKPAWSYGGLNAELWKSDNKRVVWAQQTPEFRDLLTVLINERRRALHQVPQTTENRLLGKVEGYDIAINVLESLMSGMEPPKATLGNPNYPADTETTTASDFLAND